MTTQTTGEAILRADLAIDKAKVKLMQLRDSADKEIENLIDIQRDLRKVLGDINE